jgi:mannosyltransferase
VAEDDYPGAVALVDRGTAGHDAKLGRLLRAAWVAPSGLALLAAVVRIPTLAQQSFWLDEAYTERLVRMSFWGMLHAIPGSESTPPLYYMLAWLWTRVFGFSEFGLRSLSTLAGILTVPVVYAVGARLAGRRTGVIAGGLVALAPLMVWFSQEARAYALATLVSTVTVLCFVNFLDGHDRRWLVGWAVASALGLTTHYFVGFVVAAELVWLLWSCRDDRQVGVAVALVLAVAIALVPLALAQRGTGHVDYISQGSLETRAVQVAKQLLLGYASPLQLLTSVVVVLLILVGSIQPLLARRDARRRALAPLAVGAACVLVPVALALAGVDFLNTRNLLPALPPLLIVLAIGFAARQAWPSGTVCAASIGVIFVIVLALVDADSRFQRDDWRGAGDALGVPHQARAIVISPGSGLIALQVYQSGLRPLRAPTAVSELDVVAIPGQVTGGGIARPPRAQTGFAVPPGFRPTGVSYASTYSVLRFDAPQPVTVSSATLAASHLGSGDFTVVIQSPRRH